MARSDAEVGPRIANLRDVGGLPTASGGQVRTGLLYRSGSLTGLPKDGAQLLDALGLRTVVDLRTAEERGRHPSEWHGDRVVTQISGRTDTTDMLDMIVRADARTLQDWRDRFSGFYEQLISWYAAEYGEMLRALAYGGVPMLVHCSAGKDRTGVGIAIVLTLLGVPQEAIVGDYLRTREGLRDNPAFVRMLSGGMIQGFEQMPMDARAVLLGVEAEHLEAALGAIDRAHGSMEAYAVQRLGVSQDDIAAIRALLVEP